MSEQAKRIVHEFNFKKKGAHVALVDKAANLQEVLTMKAHDSEVQVTLSMKNFLKRFFGMYEERAAMLAGIMGYDATAYEDRKDSNGDYMSTDDFIQSKIDSVQLLKGAEVGDLIPESLAQKVEELNKEFGDKLNTSEDSPYEEHDNSKTGESSMKETNIDVKELEVLKAQAKEVEALKAQLAEVDTLKSQLATMREAQLLKAKVEMTEFVKGFSFVTVEKSEALVDALIGSDQSDVFVEALEKARDAIAAVALQESGTSKADGKEETEVQGSDMEKSVDLVAGILAKRKS